MSGAADTASVFVWYRVAAAPEPAAAAIAALLRDVEHRTGVTGRLLARCDDPATWMEVYENVGDAGVFARALAELAQRHGAAGIAAGGERHVERFAPLAGIGRAASD